jgi:hypothetical protein
MVVDMPRLKETDIIRRVTYKLNQLGCPSVRQGEGSQEWEDKKGLYTKTPDIIAGPLIGDGSPQDFYIDVFSPKGDQFLNPKAGAPLAASMVNKTIDEKGIVNLGDLGNEYEPYFTPMNKKIEKYSFSRHNTPMLGLVMYYCLAGNGEYIGPHISFLNSFRALDAAFGLTKTKDKTDMDKAFSSMLGEGTSTVIIPHSIKQPISFVMLYADKIINNMNHEKTLLLINQRVTHKDFHFSQHSVIKWLKKIATPQ